MLPPCSPSLLLELAEAIDDGVLDDLTCEELAGLVASIAGDPHRVYLSIRQNPIKKDYFQNLREAVKRVAEGYQRQYSEVVVLPDAAVTVISWMESQSWADFAGLLRLGGVAEGDAARLVSQTADHLNQISHLAKTHRDLAAAAEEARRRLLRPPLLETVGLEELAENARIR